MKRFIISTLMLFTLLLISSISYAQPAHLPPPPPGHHYECICYTSLIPFPHSQCDYKLVRHHRAVIPYRYHHYRPAPHPHIMAQDQVIIHLHHNIMVIDIKRKITELTR